MGSISALFLNSSRRGSSSSCLFVSILFSQVSRNRSSSSPKSSIYSSSDSQSARCVYRSSSCSLNLTPNEYSVLYFAFFHHASRCFFSRFPSLLPQLCHRFRCFFVQPQSSALHLDVLQRFCSVIIIINPRRHQSHSRPTNQTAPSTAR